MRYTKQIRLLFIVFLVSSLVMACATMTPLTKAAKDGDINRMNALIKNGGNINERDPKTSRTPLYNAVLYNQRDAVKLLIENGANINIADEWGYTPLILALQNCHSDIAKTLIERGANINTADGQGWTPLSLAAFCNNKEIVIFLLEKGADIEISDKYGSTPLIQAAFYGHTDIAKLLINKGADINAFDNHGSTALIIAIKNRNTETARLLIEEGADIHIVDSYGRKASHYARVSESPKQGIHKASDYAEGVWKRVRKIFKAGEDYEREESLLKLLEDKEAKQAPIAVHEITQPECTQIPLQEVSPEEQTRTRKIALLPASFPPQIDVIKPDYDTLSGAGKGARAGAEIGTRLGGPGMSDSLGALVFWPALIVAGALTGAVTGAVVGGVSEFWTGEVEKNKTLQTENEVKKVLLELKIQETMAKYVQAAGKKETDLDFIVVKNIGLSSPEDKSDYTPLVMQGIDTILEITFKKIGSAKFEGLESRSYYFYMIVQAKLVRGTESSTQEFKYIIGPPRKYSEWAETGAEALQKAIEKAYKALAEDIIEFTFLYAYFEPEDSLLSRLYGTGHVFEGTLRIPVSKMFNTRYILGSLSGLTLEYPEPPDTPTFPFPPTSSSKYKVIDTLQPTFRWEAFPTAEDIRVDQRGIVNRISDVTYDLRVWRVNERYVRELIYEKKGLKDNNHKMECSLTPAGNYLWTVRARFKLDDQYKVTHWATFPRLFSRDPATGQIQGYGKDIAGSIPVIRSYYPFMTRGEYKKLNHNSGHK